MINVSIELTPSELAGEFCRLDADEMAIFFNEVASITKNWKSFQVQAVQDSKFLDIYGRMVMRKIGEYS